MRLQPFIQELEKSFELKTPLVKRDEGGFLLPLEEGVMIEIHEESDHFIFESSFGELPKDRREELFLDLLHGNLFGQGTRGAILSIDEKREQIHLRKAVLVQVPFDRLLEELEDFIETIDFWKDQLFIQK